MRGPAHDRDAALDAPADGQPDASLDPTAGHGSGVPRIRPQALLLTFSGEYLFGRAEVVLSGSLVEVLGRLGVGQHAARSTMSRMVHRGLLRRYRFGKRVFFGLTERADAVLADGERRLWQEGAVNRDWDGHWTLLGFSLPESRRADRHLLRARLLWAGFGLLQNGLWLSPSSVDVEELLTGLDVVDSVKAFRARILAPTDIDDMIADAWDLGSVADGYRAFLGRWDRPSPLPDAPDDLARHLLLLAEWLLLVRNDPRLPVEHLPADWPAVRAEHVVLRLRRAYQESSRHIADHLVVRAPHPATATARAPSGADTHGATIR